MMTAAKQAFWNVWVPHAELLGSGQHLAAGDGSGSNGMDGLSRTLYSQSAPGSRGDEAATGANGDGGGDPLTGLAVAAAAAHASTATDTLLGDAAAAAATSPLHGLTGGLGMGMDPGDLLVEFMMQAARQQ